MLLIGIHGKARVGKDTAAKYLVEHQGFIRSAFADPLKRAGQQMFMLTEEQTFGDALKEVVIPYWGMSPREMFQKLGTEGGRDVFGLDIWLKRWRLFYNTHKDTMNIVVPDVRFANEADMVRELGGTVIHLVSDRGGLFGSSAMHSSEVAIPFSKPDLFVTNNASVEELHLSLHYAVEHLESVANRKARS